MTVLEAKNKLCVWAQQQVGYVEGAGNWNKYAENAALQKLYGWKPQNTYWCDTFADVAFIECFGLENASKMTYQPIGAGSALCRQSAQYYKDNGAFYHRPEIGDQVFFYASGDINHTGIVIRVDGGSVHTVEGNSSDMVAERVYSVMDGKIAGYGRPDWSVVSGQSEVPISEKPKAEPKVEPKSAKRFYEIRLPYVSRGDVGDSVKAVQLQLSALGYSIGPDGADGDFGAFTETALKKYQRNIGVSPDGIVGPDTGAKLFGAVIGTVSPNQTKEEPKADSFWNGLLAKIKK